MLRQACDLPERVFVVTQDTLERCNDRKRWTAADLFCELLLLLPLSHVVLIYWVKVTFVKAFDDMPFAQHLCQAAKQVLSMKYE